MGRRLAGWRPVAAPVRSGLWRDSPLLVPLHAHASARRVNERLQVARLGRNMRSLSISSPVLWVYAPTALGLAQAANARAVVYHCVDDLSAFPAIPAAVRDVEEQLIQRADICIGTSRPLVDRLTRMGAREVLYWPNCADTVAYAAKERQPASSRPRPIAGFIGAVQEHKIDVELVVAVARLLPSWDFQLVGPVGEGLQVSTLSATTLPDNVHLVGARSREELPGVLAQFDVAVIPYRRNDYTNCVFPMKVFEYLAAGLPVVSTPLPSLVGEVDHVTFAETPQAWAEALGQALTEDDHVSVASRRAYAAGHSWEERADGAVGLLSRWYPGLGASKLPASVGD